MLSLRPYQKECLEAIKDLHSKGKYRQLVSLPTGAGKTVVFANLIKETGLRTLVLAHTCELLEQSKDKIQMICPSLEIGIVNSQNKQFTTPVVVSSIQSARIPENLLALRAQDFELLVYDECHHACSDGARSVLDVLGFGKGTNQLLVGFSATPFRHDGKGLGEVFDVISYKKTIKEMISEQYLCSPKGLKIATEVDFSSIKTIDGDFQNSSLSLIMDTPEMNKIIVDAYLNHAKGIQTICFTVNVQHAINLAELFRSSGVSSEAIYGTMPLEERISLLNKYRSGEVQVLCNCQILTEGFDAPETACVIVARPTKSKGLYQQMVGRGLRLWPNKRECIILDCIDKSHSICSSAILAMDSESEKISKEENSENKKEIFEKLPEKLNPKLKAAIINFDPLGESFNWEKIGNSYFMRGAGIQLNIIPQDNYYNVFLSKGFAEEKIAHGLSFEYAFAAAEDFAKKNRKLFVVSDKEAAWRNLPISEKQKALLRSYRYRGGVDQLTRGQASDLIGSGVLRSARQ